jgi:hypothetical protein
LIDSHGNIHCKLHRGNKLARHVPPQCLGCDLADLLNAYRNIPEQKEFYDGLVSEIKHEPLVGIIFLEV